MSKYPKIRFTNFGTFLLVVVLILNLCIIVNFLLNVGILNSIYKQGIKAPFEESNSVYKAESLSFSKELSKSAISISPSPLPTVKPIVYSGFCQNVPILLYHHIQQLDQAEAKGQTSLTVDNIMFENQMKYLLERGYKTISAEELAKSLINHQKLSEKSVVITLDDGYEDAYLYAYPILYKYQLKGNLMIPTGLLGNPGYLSWDELKRMVDGGFIFAYDHTWSHPSLMALGDDRAKNEILTAKRQLEEHLGKAVDIFAYPYGSENQITTQILRDNGFIAALSTIPGEIQCDSFIMSLHRTRVGNVPLSIYGL